MKPAKYFSYLGVLLQGGGSLWSFFHPNLPSILLSFPE